MDVSDEFIINQDKEKPLCLPKPCLTTPSSKGMEHIIPQINVTQADDTQQDANQTSAPEELVPSEVSVDVPIPAEFDVPSAEDVETKSTSYAEENTSSETRDEVETDVPSIEIETKSLESVTHSIAQRPLLIDSEKSISHSNIHEVDAVNSSRVNLPDAVAVTTMQRPLVFNGSRGHGESSSNLHEQDINENLVKESQIDTECSEAKTFEQDSSSLQDHSLPPSSVTQENFSYRDLDERDALVRNREQDYSSQTDTKVDQHVGKKDGLQNVKKFFGSILPDMHSEKKDSGSHTTADGEVVKKEKHGIKKLFNPSPKPDSVLKDKTHSSEEIPLKSKNESKESKYNIKKMFDSFKHDTVEQEGKSSDTTKADKLPNDLTEESKLQSKDSKSPIKKFFDSFKQENVNVPSAESPSKEDEEISRGDLKSAQKDKSGLKKFFDSFKNEDNIAESSLTKEEKEIFIKVPVALPQTDDSARASDIVNNNAQFSEALPTTSAANQSVESDKKKSKESSMKKFFDSFKHEKQDIAKMSEQALTIDPDKRSSIKKSHSFRDDLLTTKPTIGDEKSHGNIKGMKKIFDSFKHSVEAPPLSLKDQKEQTRNELKRSQSCREAPVDGGEPSHGFKSFLDSFTHKKAHIRQPHKGKVDHIYDVVETKPSPVASSSSEVVSKPSVSKKMEKTSDDQSGVKKLFDSFRHKDETSKQKSSQETAVNSKESDSVSGSKKEKSKEERSGMKKMFDSFRQKDEIHKQKTADEPKKVHMNENVTVISDSIDAHTTSSTIIINDSIKSYSDEQPISLKQNEPSKIELSEFTKVKKKLPATSVNNPVNEIDKPSVFNTISDNFSSLKGKIFQPQKQKEVKPTNEEPKTEVYDVQNAFKTNNPEEAAGTYKPLEDPYFNNENLSKELKENNYVESNIKEAASKELPLSQTTPNAAVSTKVKQKPVSRCRSVQQTSPESLYDTCCFKLAVLFPNKAIEIFSDKGKTPPKKPPKPTPEAIARARANVVSQRLKEMRYKGQSIGENIPVGYDGIRFADEETESSCDYKDVDNFDYIMDYELVNRYKFENKLESFTDPSTCSGSYYTADTVTLKDETFMDAPMETISLGSNDSHMFHHLSTSHNAAEIPNSTLSGIGSKNKFQPSNQSHAASASQQTKQTSEIQKLKCSVQSPKKRVPPPLPPKPTIIPNKTSSSKVVETSPSINGLSLSPRLQSKFLKDSAVTKSRPLLVAGLKETDFNSLPSKLKDKDKKDRKFDMVLKNESLKKINTISSASHQPLTGTKSSPSVLHIQTNTGSLSKKCSPQRPPPPSISSLDRCSLKTKVAPQVPEKPKREHHSPSSSAEKRTVSPPRPPPPTSLKMSSPPPPRPPPPVSGLHSPDKAAPLQSISNQTCESSISQEVIGKRLSDKELEDKFEQKYQPVHSDEATNIISKEVSEPTIETVANVSDIAKDQITLESDSDSKVEVTSSFEEYFDAPTLEEKTEIEATPKPPPRGRRIRSRTVEVVKVQKEVEPPLRRSQSLSDVDIHERTSNLEIPLAKTDLKHLYTSINKNGKKSSLNQTHSSSSEKLSGRPLPAPPPPPRKFRSLDRKHKKKDESLPQTSNINAVNEEEITSNSPIQPPVRKKKSDSQRFHSLGHDHQRNGSGTRSPVDDVRTRSLSVPLRPERHHKHPNVEYDENANVAISIQAEVHRSEVTLDECGNEVFKSDIPKDDMVDSKSTNFQSSAPNVVPRLRPKKDKNPKPKSHSSWYDESQGSGEWEMVDWNPADEAESKLVSSAKPRPKRRSSDPGKGSKRRTSKFYVNVQDKDSLFSLVDKETSPVRLDCSEKSVQTSLETLSQGVTSHNEDDDEDTDELLSLAQTLQNELKVIINRHKSTSDVGNESSPSNTPVLSATESDEKVLAEDSGPREKKSPSIQSSHSDIWPMTSSEESESEVPADGSANLTEIAKNRKQKKIFYIAQEIMSSEEVFVDTLKLLNVDFKAAVEAANQQKNAAVIPEEVLSQILNHLPQLQHLNENLLMELKDRIENWDKLNKIADIIVKMGPFLKLYSWYIHDFEYTLSLLEDSKKKYPLFAQTVKEFETSPRCKRLALNHYMLKPIQRIPQYRLLLQEYFDHLPEEHVDYQDTVAALHIVSEVATHANDSMKHGDNAQKLISIQNSILGHKEIIKPGRLFIKEGELMKLSRKGMQPRWFVLFNDVLLYLTPVQQGLYRVNHELFLTGMKVAIPIQQDYQNEFSIISVARSFTLAARSPEERQEWIIALTKAIEENASKRSTFTNIRLQQKTQDKDTKEEEGEFILGRKAPVWIPDARVTMCQLCTSEFTVTFRRHHCRACGKVVCSICSSNRISLPYLGNRIARVCDDCHLKLGPGSGTCTESAETDSDNQQIAVKSHLRTENKHIKRGKRNLPSVLKEVCANDQGSTISGYLQKKSGKHWKRQWFVVKDKVLYEYKASEDVAALKSVPLLGYQIESFSEGFENIDPSLLFQLTHPGQAPIIFHADTVGSTERWINALKEASVLE